MILLEGQSLTPKRKVPLEAQSLQLKERDTTSAITPADMTGISVNSWMQDDTKPGKGIVYRVRSIQTAYATNTPTVQLEHVIGTLRDRVLFGEVTAATITGRSGASTCTAKQAMEFILGKQGTWKLGTFEGDNPSNAYKFDGDDLFSALETVTETLTDVYWDYDLTALPFKLNILKLKSGDDSELRPGRNLITINRTVDKTGMYTRFYPIGANDKHISGDYVSKNEGTYGIIEKIDTDASRESEDELKSWANIELGLHAEPTVSIDVEGLELADATGEAMDRLTLMRICRVPLEEYGTTIRARIVTMNYPDKLREPERVRITMSNSRAEVTRILANVIKRAGRSARKSTKKDKQDLAWFEDTNEHVAMCAKGIIGVDAKGNPNWERLSQLVVSGEGITGTVTELINGQKASETRFTQNERAIGMVVGSYSVGEGGEEYYIKAGEICLSINEAGESEAKIDANKVFIGNEKSTTVINGKCQLSDVTADYIAGKVATLSVLNVAAISSSGNITASNGYIAAPAYYIGSGNSLRNMVSGIWALKLKNNNDGTYTLQKMDWDDDDYVDVGSFSRATSLSGTWSSGTLTVTANDTSVPSLKRTLATGTPSWATNKKSVNVPIMAQWQEGPTVHEESTGWNAYVNTTDAWQAGWDAHGQQYGDVSIDSVVGAVIGATTVKYTSIAITATASNHVSANGYVRLSKTTYNSGRHCVELQDLSLPSGSQTIGRISTEDVYQDGAGTATIDSIYGTAIAGNVLKSSAIAVTAKTSANVTGSQNFSLEKTTYGSGTHCVELSDGSRTIGRVSTESVYTDGKNAVGISAAAWDNNGAAYGSYQGGAIWKPTSRKVTISTTGRPTNVGTSVWVGIDSTSWSEGKKSVYMYRDSWSGTRMAGIEVDIGSWDYGPIGHSSSAYSNIQKEYTVNANYKYAVISVTVADKKKRIQLKIIR